ncbi:ATP-binding protein [Actinomadura scrupuli]|uniref:ATP-binding protein n=1 Tax=Actinomadura scrupuli TaxID=559629 RepID=UPI003D99DAC7
MSGVTATDPDLDGEPPYYAMAFRPTEVAVPAGRALTKAALELWGLAELRHDATLIVSELLTNSIRYAGAVTLLLYFRDAELTVEVGDDSPELPVLENGRLLAESGRGLFLVQAYADDWGCRPAGAGKVIWATLRYRMAGP